MKLENGKAYVTRDGKHTVIVRGPLPGPYPYDGAVAGRPAEWDADGFFFVAGMPNDLDLVAEVGAATAGFSSGRALALAERNHTFRITPHLVLPTPQYDALQAALSTPPVCTCEMHGPQGLMAVGCTCGAPIRA